MSRGRGLRVTRCRETGCGETIIWCVTTLDKSIPVDVAPVENGNLRLTPQGHRKPPRAEVVPASERTPGHQLHISHFATCPARNKKKGQPKPTAKPARARPGEQGELFSSGDAR